MLLPVWKGFTLEDCAPVRGDHHDIALEWKGDLAALRGKSVQLHFDMFNADLYAIDFTGK